MVHVQYRNFLSTVSLKYFFGVAKILKSMFQNLDKKNIIDENFGKLFPPEIQITSLVINFKIVLLNLKYTVEPH